MSKQWSLEYYQNVYSSVDGSSELPASGRHFSKYILEKLKAKGVIIEYITLHTGLSSIVVQEEEFEQHAMHSEEIEISQKASDIINSKRKSGGRLFGIGTTVVRTLETVATEDGILSAFAGFTNLYIYPGYKFKTIDAFVTNFHGPRSTRIALAAAFTGEELLKKGYDQAINSKFRFFEFGDATLTI
jgi:S-adenosylmethionine:tRNA ribosyltransferase-isomerase